MKALQPTLSLVIACLIYLVGPLVQAANTAPQQTLPKYKVEIIIFQTLALKGWTEEYWPHNPAYIELPEVESATNNTDAQTTNNTQAETLPFYSPNAQSATEVDLNTTQDYDYPTTLEELDLITEVAKMTPEKGYDVLMHQAWVFTGYPEAQAEAMFLSLEPESDQGSRIEGTLKLYKSRYAHVDLNLEIERVIPNRIRALFAEHERIEPELLPEFWRFQLKESRKVKSGELHYFDHPIFGALLKIQYIKGSQRDITPEEEAEQ